MPYITADDVEKTTGEGWIENDQSGIISTIIDIADLKVKALVQKAGLSAPTSSDILKVASLEFVKAELVRRGRFTGSIAKAGANPDTYDSVNRAIKLHTDMALSFVEAYISSASTSVYPSDTAGQARGDLTGTNFKLDQSTISGFED